MLRPCYGSLKRLTENGSLNPFTVKGKSYFLPPAALAAPDNLARISSSRRMR